MKLSECTHGKIVVKRRVFPQEKNMIGMVSGISENPQGEAIPVVSWQDGTETPHHHANLDLYEE